MISVDDDLGDVLGAETRRGRRPIDPEQRRRRNRLVRLALKAIQDKDERGFLSVLREGGVKDGTAEFAEALRLFREKVGSSGK